jgi:hypothetical protein
LKDPKRQKKRSQSSAPNTRSIPIGNVRAAQKTKPVVATASHRIQLPPSGFKLPNVSMPNFRAPTIEEVGDGIGNAAKGLLLFGGAVLTGGAMLLQ